MSPKISVIMSVYNGADFLDKAIESVLNQSLGDFEFIIVDDCSTDSSLNIINKFASNDSRLVIIKNERNMGLTMSLNRAIDKASGEYIARIDSDDICYSQRFLSQVSFLDKNRQCVMVGSWANIIDEEDRVIKTVKYPTESDVLRAILIKHNPFFHSSIMIRTDVLLEIGKYNENYRFAQDYDLYLRIIEKYNVANIPDILIGYRETEQSITSVKNRKQVGCVIRAKIQALNNNLYPKYYYFFLFKDFIAWIVPVRVKKFVKKLFRHVL